MGLIEPAADDAHSFDGLFNRHAGHNPLLSYLPNQRFASMDIFLAVTIVRMRLYCVERRSVEEDLCCEVSVSRCRSFVEYHQFYVFIGASRTVAIGI